jgi:hypothetical protein
VVEELGGSADQRKVRSKNGESCDNLGARMIAESLQIQIGGLLEWHVAIVVAMVSRLI